MPLIDSETRQRLAVKAANDLVGMVPPLDVPDPETFMAGLVATIAGFHQDVIVKCAVVIAQRTDRPTLKAVRDICMELLEPISRQIERQKHTPLPAPQKPSQDRRDAAVAEWHRIKGKLGASLQPMPGQSEPRPEQHDGKHSSRVMADLAARAAWREAQEPR